MHEDDAAAAHDRLRACRPRASGEQQPPAPTAGARVPELSALLGELDSLRLALSADLGLAASAVEVGAFDVARDVISGGQEDVAGFSLRAEQLLAPREPVPAAPEEPEPAEPEVVALAPRRRSRRLSLLAPALTAAAALVGLLSGIVPSPATGPVPAPMTHAAHDSYAELWRLHDGGASSARVAAAARDLHSEVARLVARAADDPAGAQQALRLLELELALLDAPQHGGALAPEKAQSQRLLARLRQALARTPVGEVLAQAPQPGRSPAPVPAPLVVVPLPEAPLAAPELPRLRPVQASPSTAPTATGEPSTAPEPTGRPSPGPEQSPTPAPSPQAEPEPSPTAAGSLLPPRSPGGATGSAALLDADQD